MARDMNADYNNHLIGRNWTSWRSWCELLNLPLSGLQPHVKATQAKGVRFCRAEQWIFSTAALLALLARWTRVLRGDGPDLAMHLLGAFLSKLPARMVIPVELAARIHSPDSAVPTSLHECDGMISVADGVVDAESLYRECPDLQTGYSRTALDKARGF